MTLGLFEAHQRYESELAFSDALNEWLEETLIDDIMWKGHWNDEFFLDEIIEDVLELNGDYFDNFYLMAAMLVTSREEDFAKADYERYVRRMVDWYILDHLGADEFVERFEQYLEEL